MFDEKERKVLTELFAGDIPMYMHRLSDYAGMFEGAPDAATPDARARATAFLEKLGVLEDVMARDSGEHDVPAAQTRMIGGHWGEHESGGAVTRVAPAPATSAPEPETFTYDEVLAIATAVREMAPETDLRTFVDARVAELRDRE